MSTASPERHRASRSGRCVGAVGLVAVAVVMTGAALMSGSHLDLVAALDVVLVTAVAALLYDVIVELRRQASRQRADLSVQTTAHARDLTNEHIAFTFQLGEELRGVRDRNEHLVEQVRYLELRLAEADTALATHRAAAAPPMEPPGGRHLLTA